MKTKKIIISGIVIWIVGTIIMFSTCASLFAWIYQIPPIIWKTGEEIMSISNMLWLNLFGILIAMIFALVYAVLYAGIPGTGIKKGLMYGFLVWLIGAFSGMLTMPLYMTIAPAVVVYWIILALVKNLIFGVIVAAIYK